MPRRHAPPRGASRSETIRGTARNPSVSCDGSPTTSCPSTRSSCPPTTRRTWSPRSSSTWATLDYPMSKLQVLLLMEADDADTIAAAKAARPPDHVRFVVVPAGGPQTKPKACNVGLALAEGEFLVIYDAEDRPEPEQLREVVAALPRDARRRRVPPGAAELLQRTREPAHPDVHARVLVLVRRHAARASTRCGCRSRSAARRTTFGSRRCVRSAGGTRTT